jgi:starch synthase
VKVLYVCTELFPFLKTGGLADVDAGLPPALHALGCDVRLLMPGFPALVYAATSSRPIAPLPQIGIPWGRPPVFPAAEVALTHFPALEVPIYLLHAPALYARPGNPYLGPDGADWSDNAQRFAALGWAAANLGQGLDPDWVPDIIHCHDWHTGLAPAYNRAFARAGRPTPATVFTIHNLAYQGLFPGSIFPLLGLPESTFDVEGLEFFGQVSFMKAGIRYSDRIATVSPTYAQEIRSEAMGCGLDGLLRARAGVLTGILNGVDYQVWSPTNDTALPVPYDSHSLAGKEQAKQVLQTRLGLEPRPEALLFGVVSRITAQKGLHLLSAVLPDLVQRGGQLALLGQGDATLEQAFVDAAIRYPRQIGVCIGYDEATAHTVVAGSDVLVVPSEFEPCGLTQLYGLRYGTLPLVHRVGGLADTVIDCTLENLDEGIATGFTFNEFNSDALIIAIHRAFALSHHPEQWTQAQRHGMQLRFDWHGSALRYLAMYQSLRPAARPNEPTA